MSALTFPTTAKNALLDLLTGRTNTSQTGHAMGKLRLTGGGVSYYGGATGVAVTWGSAVAGVIPLTTASITPSAGTIDTIEWWGTTPVTYTGTPSITGGGGNIIIVSPSSLALTAVPTSILASLRVPLSNGTIRINETLASALATLIAVGGTGPALCNAGSLVFYDGTQPALADTGPGASNVCGTFTTAATGADWAAAAAGATALAAAKNVTASSSNTPTWARLTKGSYVMDFSVGANGAGGKDITFAGGAWTNTTVYSMTTCTLTWP